MGKDDETIINFFKLIYEKGYNYLIELSEIDFYLCFNKIKFYFSFLNSEALNNYNFKGLSSLNEIDLSEIKLYDIKKLCGDVPFINLKTLKLCNNTEIINLHELKNAKFINLQNLDLSSDGISDLKEIEMEKYPFLDLKNLDLSSNHLTKIEPVLHFERLEYLNLKDNHLKIGPTLILIENLKSLRAPEL